MKLIHIKPLFEGGWASAATQGTVIKPTTIRDLMGKLKEFEGELNQFLEKKGIPSVIVGKPVGSGTYYQDDLENNPDKEYGDIDVQFIIPRIQDSTTAQTRSMYTNAIKEFADMTQQYETNTGVNVIFHDTPVGPIQIDMVLMFDDRVEWTAALAPEHGTKGVLSASLYSALAQVLNISISDEGIQAKKRGDEVVPYSQRKDTTTHSVTHDKKNWAIDIVRFLGAKQLSDSLKQNPGMKDAVRIPDIVASIKGIADTLDINGIKSYDEVVGGVKEVYLKKLDSNINSPKFDKAETPEAKAKAQKTKDMLYTRSREVASLLD